MQFESFHWLSHHKLWAIIPCPTNMPNGKHMRNFLVRFKFYFSLVFYVLVSFLMKQLFHSTGARWIWGEYRQLDAMHLVGYMSFHIQPVLME